MGTYIITLKIMFMKKSSKQVLKSYTPAEDEKLIFVREEQDYNVYAVYKDYLYDRQIKIAK
jgi:hypothetical protein